MKLLHLRPKNVLVLEKRIVGNDPQTLVPRRTSRSGLAGTVNGREALCRIPIGASFMLKSLCGAVSVGLSLAVATSTFAQTVPPGTTGNPAANQPGIPGAVSPSNPNAASRPQVPNIGGSPIVTKPNTKCRSGSARGRAGC
jgi:hypothetical protein